MRTARLSPEHSPAFFLLPSPGAVVATGMPYHSHATRDCIWQVLAGTAELAVDSIAPASVAAFAIVGTISR